MISTPTCNIHSVWLDKIRTASATFSGVKPPARPRNKKLPTNLLRRLSSPIRIFRPFRPSSVAGICIRIAEYARRYNLTILLRQSHFKSWRNTNTLMTRSPSFPLFLKSSIKYALFSSPCNGYSHQVLRACPRSSECTSIDRFIDKNTNPFQYPGRRVARLRFTSGFRVRCTLGFSRRGETELLSAPAPHSMFRASLRD